MPRVDEATRVRILTLVQEGRTRRSIAAEIGCALGTVTRIVCAFRDDGRIRDMEREGRPRRTTAEEDQWIIAAACCDPSMTAAEIREELGLQVSLSTIRKRLHAAGLRSRVACQRPLLTQSHKRLRLEFATNHLAWTVEDWKLVVFSDESTFCSKGDQQRCVWRPVCSR
ncbi:hypothetical protein HPB47_010995 [Ixodes persulcatus]|uniref:Uncharacterized protein n=1 Tax=Ixodes persulcatus TaxID=34615 RepID=A0AC60NXL6_IXOPE|nr:hypothetical protein HPB47_010995 [Ixodes persulcatus]